MPELRQDPTTREWVIVAPERAKRPQQGSKKSRADDLPGWDKSCPFCPGNESQTPGEVFSLPVEAQPSAWEVRVIPNRFSALTPEEDTVRIEKGRLFRKMGGFGVHEVIIESPSHNTPLALMTCEQVHKVLIAYQQRYNTLKKKQQIQCINIFKNYGLRAGTSLAHPHSQLVATPIMAPEYNRKFDVAHDYFSDMGTCLYCDLISSELKDGVNRLVAETDEFVIMHPYASRVPYETWIVPKKHYASFGLFPATGLVELAKVLKGVLLCLYQGLDDPAFNLVVDSTTTNNEENPYYHWHIMILPRLSTIAGFEMGTGIHISSALPEDTAKKMRRCALSLPEDGCFISEH
ncbi:galactose-1-phosphate uridylyltransferase [Chloroflexota bacterium]